MQYHERNESKLMNTMNTIELIQWMQFNKYNELYMMNAKWLMIIHYD